MFPVPVFDASTTFLYSYSYLKTHLISFISWTSESKHGCWWNSTVAMVSPPIICRCSEHEYAASCGSLEYLNVFSGHHTVVEPVSQAVSQPVSRSASPCGLGSSSNISRCLSSVLSQHYLERTIRCSPQIVPTVHNNDYNNNNNDNDSNHMGSLTFLLQPSAVLKPLLPISKWQFSPSSSSSLNWCHTFREDLKCSSSPQDVCPVISPS